MKAEVAALGAKSDAKVPEAPAAGKFPLTAQQQTELAHLHIAPQMLLLRRQLTHRHWALLQLPQAVPLQVRITFEQLAIALSEGNVNWRRAEEVECRSERRENGARRWRLKGERNCVVHNTLNWLLLARRPSSRMRARTLTC